MGFVNLYTSRRTYHLRCEWYKAKRDNEKLVYDEQPNGYFYARYENSMEFGKEVIGGVVQQNNNSITLLTCDNVNDLQPNDKVVFQGKECRVLNKQESMIKKQSEFALKPSVVTYIELRF